MRSTYFFVFRHSLAGPLPDGGQQRNSPTKFSKPCSVVKYNIKFPPKSVNLQQVLIILLLQTKTTHWHSMA